MYLVVVIVVHVLPLLLVGHSLLPLGVRVGTLAGLPRVELGLVLLGLLLLPLVQSERLGLFLPRLLGRSLLAALLLSLGLVARVGLLGVGGDVVLVLFGLPLPLDENDRDWGNSRGDFSPSPLPLSSKSVPGVARQSLVAVACL